MGEQAWIYILECADGSYYVGSTTDLALRIAEHKAGLGGKYTSARLPVQLVFSQECADIQEAYDLERQVKGWRRAKKHALIQERYADLPALAHTRRAVPSTGSGNALPPLGR